MRAFILSTGPAPRAATTAGGRVLCAVACAAMLFAWCAVGCVSATPALASAAGLTPASAAAGAHAGGVTHSVATVRTATAPPPGSVYFEEESRSTFESQLAAKQIREAEFNKVAEHLHLILDDGHRVFIAYPGHEEPALERRVLAAGVPVTIEYTPVKASARHHTIRYVAVVVLILALVVLAALLIIRRRRLGGPPAAPGAGGADAEMGGPAPSA